MSRTRLAGVVVFAAAVGFFGSWPVGELGLPVVLAITVATWAVLGTLLWFEHRWRQGRSDLEA